MSEDAQLGFSVDTSGLEYGADKLDKLGKSAKSATDSIDKLSDSMKNVASGGMHASGFYSGLQSSKVRIINEITEAGEKAGMGFWSKFFDGLKENHTAQRELTVMSHEALSGNFGRLRGSASILLSNLGMGGLGAAGLMVGGTMLVEGIDALVESMKEATQAREDMNDAAINSGNVGAVYAGQLDNIIDKIKTVGDMSKETKEKIVSTALNAGLSPDFIQNHMDTLSGYYNSLGDKAAEGADKILAEAQTDATKGYKMLAAMGGAFLDKVNDDISSGKYKQAGADMISGLIDGMDKAARAKENLDGKLKGESFWDSMTYYMGLGAIGQGGTPQSVELQQKVMKDHDDHVNFIKQQSDKAQIEKQQYIASLGKKKNDLSNTKAYHDFDKFNHPSFSTHRGLTAAQRAAEEAQRWQASMDAMNQSITQSNKSQLNSLQRSFDNKTYQFSMTGDYHNLVNQIEQENERADRLITALNERYTRANKPHDSEYAKTLSNINQGRQLYIQQAKNDYQQLEDINQSSLDGMKKGWITYSDDLSNIMSETASTYKNVMDDMQDMLVNFLDTGKLDIDKFLKSVLEDVEKMFVEQDIMKPMNSFIGGMFGFNAKGVDTSGGAYSYGGDVANWVSGLFGATQNVGATNSLGATSGVQVNVYNQGGQNVNGDVKASNKQYEDMGRQVQKALTSYIKQQNVNSNRSGGINKSMGNWSTK